MAIIPKKSFRIQTVISTVLVLCIIVVVNYLGMYYHKHFDFTETRLYSLSDKSKKVLGLLKEEMEATYFYKDAPNDESIDILKEYEAQNKWFHLFVYDLDKHPEIAKKYDVKNYNTLVLTYQNHRKKLTMPEEQDITNAIVRLVKRKKIRICFSVGHGERSFTDYSRTGFSKMIYLIQKQNYEVDTLITATITKIPENCDLVIVNGSLKRWTIHEMKLLYRFVNAGGNLLLNLDDNKSGLNKLLGKWNFKICRPVVIDMTAKMFGTSPGITTLLGYEYHEITKGFRLMTAFELPRQIKITRDTLSRYNFTEFLKSSEQSWAETDRIDKEVEFNDGKDIIGPVPFGVAVQFNKPKARLVIISDSDYGSNAYMGFAGNSDLYLNILSWLTEQEDLISIRTKEFTYQRLDVPQNRLVLFFTIILVVLPAIIISTGIIVWVKRRR